MHTGAEVIAELAHLFEAFWRAESSRAGHLVDPGWPWRWWPLWLETPR